MLKVTLRARHASGDCEGANYSVYTRTRGGMHAPYVRPGAEEEYYLRVSRFFQL